MSDVLDRYRKRRWRKVKIAGDEFTIRGTTKAEQRRAQALKPELRNAMCAAFMMLEDDGSQIFTQGEGETDEDFATRVDKETEDIQIEVIVEVAVASAKLVKPPGLEDLIKNSGETTKPG